MSEPTASPGDAARFPGLDLLARPAPAGLTPVEVTYARGDGRAVEELRVRRTNAPGRPYVAWVERLAVGQAGAVVGHRRRDRTIRVAATPWAAAAAACAAAGWPPPDA